MTGNEEPRFVKARTKLVRATEQWDQATMASWRPTEAGDCVTKCFYSFENAVVAAAIALDIRWEKQHFHKAQIAKQLAQNGHVTPDVSDLLSWLNELRKDISYGEPGPHLMDINLEDLLSDLESYLAEVEQVIGNAERI